jgi:hypothetical protein
LSSKTSPWISILLSYYKMAGKVLVSVDLSFAFKQKTSGPGTGSAIPCGKTGYLHFMVSQDRFVSSGEGAAHQWPLPAQQRTGSMALEDLHTERRLRPR